MGSKKKILDFYCIFVLNISTTLSLIVFNICVDADIYLRQKVEAHAICGDPEGRGGDGNRAPTWSFALSVLWPELGYVGL